MTRVSIKIVGASGQGIDSMGEVVARGLKRSGFCVFGYREYPSLIKGGHASYQLDWSDEEVKSTETTVNVVVTLNHHGLEKNIPDLKPGGILLHATPHWKFGEKEKELIERLSLSVVELPIEKTLKDIGAKPIMANVILTAFLWALLGQDMETLKTVVGERFAKKKALLELNMRSIEAGFGLRTQFEKLSVVVPKPVKKWKDHLLLTGSKAMGLGAIHAGVRLYAGYPMTPSSPLLTYIAGVQNQTGMVIKQAEDEITAAQMVSGAMHAGTRALTATSGGGFDLMAETFSMNGIIENPAVFVLAQRPGPGTGLPTWTAQADLLMAVGMAHGEFARCVIAVSDSEDSFHLMSDAFNIAEEFQTPVIVLIDKQIAEALYTQQPFDQKRTKVKRGLLITDPKELSALQSSDRFDPTVKDGISKRWLPGAKAATYDAQADEHSGDGSSVEDAENAVAQMEKRMRKMEALKKSLPEPELFEARSGKRLAESDDEQVDVLLVGWGSTKPVVLDALANEQLITNSYKPAYLHFTHLWPLKTGRFERLAKKAKRIVTIEGNYQGQLATLLRQECSITVTDKILKYDGRPFFVDELATRLAALLTAHSS